LAKTVLSEFKTLIQSYDIQDEEINQNIVFEERLQNDLDSLHKKVATYYKKIDECTAVVKNLYIDKVKLLITDDEFIEFSKEFHQDKENYQRQIQNAEEEIGRIKQNINSALNKDEILQKHRDIKHLQRIHVDSLIDYIEVGKKIPKTKNRKINIYWNF